MSALIVTAAGTPFTDDGETRVIHPAREKGYESGAAVAPNDAILVQVIDVAMTCMLDEAQREMDRERAYENLLGFLDGYHDMMAVQPLLFLTRQQTAKVNRLPRRIRRAWMSEYQRGVRAWRHRGGSLVEGNQPVLPAIPG